MKKIFAVILSVVMLMCLSVTAFAANVTDQGTGSYSGNVTGSYVAGGSGGTVYSVDIAWEGLSFTYQAAGEQWDPSTHQYVEHGTAGWASDTGTITVTNHSNAAITATPSYQAATGYETANVTFSTDALNVISAATNNKAETGTITVTPTGTLPEETTGATIGTITITIS